MSIDTVPVMSDPEARTRSPGKLVRELYSVGLAVCQKTEISY